MVPMTSDTTPIPYVASASTVNAGPGHEAYRAFDFDNNYQWLSNDTGVPQWIKLDWGAVGGARILHRYALVILPHVAPTTRYPFAWLIQGSHDNFTWVDIDSQTGWTSTLWDAQPRREFDYADVTTAYRYTRMLITANNGDPNFVGVTNFDPSTVGFVCRLY